MIALFDLALLVYHRLDRQGVRPFPVESFQHFSGNGMSCPLNVSGIDGRGTQDDVEHLDDDNVPS